VRSNLDSRTGYLRILFVFFLSLSKQALGAVNFFFRIVFLKVGDSLVGRKDFLVVG
jgi:hypothetical protein